MTPLRSILIRRTLRLKATTLVFFFVERLCWHGAETTTVAGINLRQGSAADAPSVIGGQLVGGHDLRRDRPVPENRRSVRLCGFGFARFVNAASARRH